MKPVIIGMNNPLSSDPKYALFPHPPGCTGYRLWKMLEARTGVFRAEYIQVFERRNLVPTKEWCAVTANVNARSMLPELGGRTVLLLGNEVRKAFGVPPLLVHPQEIGGVTWRQLPHPSGRNRWYNDPENVRLAEVLMQDLYECARRQAVLECA